MREKLRKPVGPSSMAPKKLPVPTGGVCSTLTDLEKLETLRHVTGLRGEALYQAFREQPASRARPLSRDDTLCAALDAGGRLERPPHWSTIPQ